MKTRTILTPLLFILLLIGAFSCSKEIATQEREQVVVHPVGELYAPTDDQILRLTGIDNMVEFSWKSTSIEGNQVSPLIYKVLFDKEGGSFPDISRGAEKFRNNPGEYLEKRRPRTAGRRPVRHSYCMVRQAQGGALPV